MQVRESKKFWWRARTIHPPHFHDPIFVLQVFLFYLLTIEQYRNRQVDVHIDIGDATRTPIA